MENESLATELLREVKASARRWFVAFCIMVVLELATIIGFMWYISLPTEEGGTAQTIDNVDNSDVRQVVGDYNGESDTDNILQETGSKSPDE